MKLAALRIGEFSVVCQARSLTDAKSCALKAASAATSLRANKVEHLKGLRGRPNIMQLFDEEENLEECSMNPAFEHGDASLDDILNDDNYANQSAKKSRIRSRFGSGESCP